MSNGTNAPYGFKPYFYAGQSQIPLMEVDVDATQDGGAIAEGDAITWDTGATGGVQRAAANNRIMGVCASFHGVTSQFIPWAPYIAALTAGKMQLVWHPQQILEVQGDVTALTLAQRFLNADHVNATPSAVTNRSTQYLNGAAIAATNTLGFKIWDYLRVEDNQIADTYPRYLVISNKSFWADQIVGPS